MDLKETLTGGPVEWPLVAPGFGWRGADGSWGPADKVAVDFIAAVRPWTQADRLNEAAMILGKAGPGNRVDWHPYFMGLAIAAARRGECSRRQVGAVLVKVGGRQVLSTGYNGTKPNAELSCLRGDCPRASSGLPVNATGAVYAGAQSCFAIHAEINAMRDLQYNDMNWATMYVTNRPCDECCTVMWIGGIQRIVYWEPGPVGWSAMQEMEHLNVADLESTGMARLGWTDPVTLGAWPTPSVTPEDILRPRGAVSLATEGNSDGGSDGAEVCG